MAKSKYARDPAHGKPPVWRSVYAKHCPQHTDGSSRHTKVIAESLRDVRSPVRKLLIDAGYDADHWAGALERTVIMLWEARAEIERLSSPLDCPGYRP